MLSIGKLAAQTGVKVPTIRYYEATGLLGTVGRSAGNQRLYAPAAAARLRFIRHARDLGFPLEAIRDLLSLAGAPDQPCAGADRIARAQLEATRSRIARLTALAAELERMVEGHAHGTVADCRVIGVLADHGLCAGDHDPD